MNIKNKLISWIPALIWMVVIFYLSSQPAADSNNLSRGITEQIIETLGKIIPFEVEIGTSKILVAQLNHFIRKSAHFMTYFILGILVTFASLKNGLKSRALYISFIFCVLFAISDEVHQLFVPGRGGMLKDVVLDSIGSLIGITLYLLVNKINERGKKNE